MDFSRFENALTDQKSRFDQIKNIKDAAKYDEICISVNQTLADISLVASCIPVSEKAGLVPVLHDMKDFAGDLTDYKNSFDEEKVEENDVEKPIEITTDEEPSNSQSQTESQSLQKGNVKTLALTNPNLPAGVTAQAA